MVTTNPFESFMPGFDFLKSFAQANPHAAMPTAAQWVTPTLDPDELDKRIQDLKSVQFWLDQNAKALSATIQALEVQRMTLSTLQSMNVGWADVAASMTGQKTPHPGRAADAASTAKPASVDPMSWWTAVGQQFQSIATQAMTDMQKHAAHATQAAAQASTRATAKPSASSTQDDKTSATPRSRGATPRQSRTKPR